MAVKIGNQGFREIVLCHDFIGAEGRKLSRPSSFTSSRVAVDKHKFLEHSHMHVMSPTPLSASQALAGQIFLAPAST